MAVFDLNRYNWLTKLYQFLVVWFFFLPLYTIFYRLKVYGRENIPRDGKPFIVMPNHLSNLDPPLVSTALRIPIAYMAKIELYSIPVIGFLITILGAYSVNRDKVTKTTIKTTTALLGKNWAVGMFLEGTRSRTPGVLGKPFVGPAYIANLANVPILPIGIVGSDKPFGPAVVRIGKLFSPSEDLETAKWQCAKKLSELTGFKVPEKEL